MRYSFQTEQWVPYSPSRVFDFFADPNNLPRLMPAWQRARIDSQTIVPPPARPDSTDSQPTHAAGSGSRLTLSFRPIPYSPVRLSWLAEIAEFVWNEHFCDRQLRGPFAYWNHCHYVRPAARAGVDGTLIADDLEYEIPFGISGEIAHRLLLRRQIEHTFAVRHTQLSRILAQTMPPSQQPPAP